MYVVIAVASHVLFVEDFNLYHVSIGLRRYPLRQVKPFAANPAPSLPTNRKKKQGEGSISKGINRAELSALDFFREAMGNKQGLN